MKKACRVIAIILSVKLVLSSISYDALALRPMAHRLTDKRIIAKGKVKAIDGEASLKRINELLWKWNFRIDVLSHKRKYLEGQEKGIGNVLRSVDAVIRDMRKHLRTKRFKNAVSETAIERLRKAIKFLPRKRKERPKKKAKKKRRSKRISMKKSKYIHPPNEPAANRLITSVMLEIKKLREPALKQRLDVELTQPRVLYSYKRQKWYVREQRYKYSKKWKTSVLSYRYIPYDTLWEAFRAVDHQIDTELEERNWLLDCQQLLDKVRKGEIEDKAKLKEDIDSMLARLRKVRVEDKRLARIILKGAKDLLDYERPKQAKGYLSITKDLFAHRIKETEQIVDKLQEGRLTKLREEADKKNRYLMDKAAKILHDLKGYHYGLTAKIIEEDFIEGPGRRYLKEPDFVPFVDSIQRLHERLKGEPLDRDDVEAVKRFFLLFHDRVVASMATDNFMEDYRDEYVKVSLDPESVKKSREEVFEEVFTRYRAEDPNVKKSPKIYWTIFYQAAFVSPKIGKPGEREDNPEFLKLSDAIMKVQAKKVDIRPKGLELLLHLKDIAEESILLTPGYLINRIDLAIAQAA